MSAELSVIQAGQPANRSRRFAAFADQFVRRIALLPLRVRRGLLRLFCDLARIMAGIGAQPRAVRIIRRALQMPEKTARQTANEALFQDALFQMEWVALGARGLSGLIADAERIRIENDAALCWLAAQRGGVFATLHMGSYPLAFACLLHRYLQGRKVVIVKSLANDADERRALDRLCALGVEVEFLRPGEPAHFPRLLRLVRGGAFVFALVDLPPDYGKFCDIELLWHRARIARGVVYLAAICGVPIALFRVESETGGDRIIIDSLTEMRRDDHSARDRLIGQIGGFLTRALLHRPGAWLLWDRFPEYLPSQAERPA